MAELTFCVELHADSARERPLEQPKPALTIAPSYLPGHVVLTLEDPLRTIVIDAHKLIDALQS